MYSTRSNASARKPFDIYQFGLKPQFPMMDLEKPDPPKTLGFGTLPSPKAFSLNTNDKVYGLPIGTNGIYDERQVATPEELQDPPPLLEPAPRPAGMHSAWQEDAYTPPSVDPINDFALSRKTAQMQGVPMGANNGSIVNPDDFQLPQDPSMMYQPQQFQQPQYQPMMQGGPMPYQGGMSGPHFQGQMQSMLGDLLSRQNMGRQYNDMAMARDGYDDAWDRARANFLNPLMGGLMGGNQIAAMQQDSNNRMNQIMDRRQLRRQAMNDQWGQTKDLVGMIAANDPQTLKNQNALAKLQMEMYQKAINQQNANTQQFGAQSNAQYRSRMADVAEQKGRVAESNLLRMIQEGADRSQRGWAQIEQNKAKWESSLEMRKMELEQRKQQAAASNDIRMMQLIQKDEADLADEEYKYAKISSDLEAKAAEVGKFGAPKRSAEFVDKYGTKAAPGKEPAQQPNQALDIINALGNLFQRAAGGNQPSAPGAADPKPVPGKPQATSGGTKPITADVVRMLKAKYPNDMNAAMAEARRLGYKVN